MSKVDSLLRAALILIDDGCPPDRGAYFCRQCDAEAELCSECWRQFFFDLANGKKTA